MLYVFTHIAVSQNALLVFLHRIFKRLLTMRLPLVYTSLVSSEPSPALILKPICEVLFWYIDATMMCMKRILRSYERHYAKQRVLGHRVRFGKLLVLLVPQRQLGHGPSLRPAIAVGGDEENVKRSACPRNPPRSRLGSASV